MIKNKNKKNPGVENYLYSAINKAHPASLSIEAALCTAFFAMSIAALISVFYIFMLKATVQDGMEYACKKASAYMYMAEKQGYIEKLGDKSSELSKALLSGVVTEAYLTGEVMEYAQKELKASRVLNGVWGLNPVLSDISLDRQEIDFILSYNVKIPFVPSKVLSVQVIQRSIRKMWTGTQRWMPSGDNDDDQMVYITESGTVYHTNRGCPYISPDIEKVLDIEIDDRRNNSGEKYYPCEKCDSKSHIMVYITKEGNRYHSDMNCSSLRRAVRIVPLSSIPGWRCCTKCAASAGQ